MPASPYFTVEVDTKRVGHVLGPAMRDRLKNFERQEKRARVKAAHTAQQTSLKSVRYERPANAAPRRGRAQTTRLRSHIRWSPDADDSTISLDTARLDTQARHWIIQEIGTGERATVKRGGVKNPRGRARKGAAYIRTVKSQKGRRISSGLAFGTGPSGRFVPPGGGQRQQLYPIKDLSGWTPTRTRTGLRRRPLVIRNEIKGKHFIRDGARAGAREYRASVRAAARSAFAGQRYRP